ncbi:MAG: aldolase [Chloroflexi bacterium]|nr:aldolase [Chloroflexota bacterium]
MLLTQFQTVGRDLFARELISSHSGNMSVRMGAKLFITRRGCMLNNLCDPDLVETGIGKNDRATPLAPEEIAVHRAIYRLTPSLAVIHAHPPHAIAISLAAERKIVPNDAEGHSLLPDVPVIRAKGGAKTAGLADEVAAALKTHRIVMVSGHGCFAAGQLLEEAFQCTISFEESCRILCLLKSLGVKPSLRPQFGA